MLGIVNCRRAGGHRGFGWLLIRSGPTTGRAKIFSGEGQNTTNDNNKTVQNGKMMHVVFLGKENINE